jgi:hypothetical protein
MTSDPSTVRKRKRHLTLTESAQLERARLIDGCVVRRDDATCDDADVMQESSFDKKRVVDIKDDELK